jgi:hypothetical protein
MPEATELRIDLTLEQPIGTILYEWTLIVDGCDTGEILHNGPTGDIPVPTTTTTESPTTTALTTVTAAAVQPAAAPSAVAAEPRFTG